MRLPRRRRLIDAGAAQLRFVLAELALALTFCRTASNLSRTPILRGILQARKALQHSADFLKNFSRHDPELAEVASRTEILDESLRSFIPSLQAPPRDGPDALDHA